jgi:sporulation related protein
MRVVLILLVLANLTFLAYTRLDSGSDGEAVRLSEQVQPDRIKLLTPQEVAALGPAKIAALADVCLEWGPLSEPERTRALADLEPLALGRLLTQRRHETSTAFWVYLPPLASRADADRRAADVKTRGVTDASVVDTGNQRFAVALGAYPTEEAAKARLAELTQQGLTAARVGARQQTGVQTHLVIRDPQASVLARVRELAAGYPDSEVKVGNCDKG